MKAFNIVGYTFEADVHCVDCTRRTIGYWGLPALAERDENGIPLDLLDSAGNAVQPIFADQVAENDACGDCFEELIPP